MRKALIVILANMIVSISVAAQISSDRVIKEEDKLRRRWWVSMSLASVFDTNITHDEQQVRFRPRAEFWRSLSRQC